MKGVCALKKAKIIVLCCMIGILLCGCFSVSAKEPSLVDIWPEFLDILPWDVKTGEYTDGRNVAKDEGENPEKGRQEESQQIAKEEEELRKRGEEQMENDKEEEITGWPKTKEKEVKSIDLVVILDRSGSMYGMEKDTIGGFNSMLAEQRKKDVPVKVTLITFNQKVDTLYERKPLEEIVDMKAEDYVPQGTTALLDAVGNALVGLGADKDVNTEGNKVLVVITTDGYENASVEWTWSKVRALIKNLEAEKGYQFVFLGADINAERVAEDMGIRPQTAVKYKKTVGSSGGVQANFRAVNVMIETVSDGEDVSRNLKWKDSIVEDKE